MYTHNHFQSKPVRFHIVVALLVSMALLVVQLPFARTAVAAPLTSISNTMSSLTVSATSSNTLRFITPTGANNNTDTIIITFPADFNFTSKVIGTVTFTHGASTGLETTETLAAAPSASAWGAVFSGTQNRILTLTAPTDGIGAAVLAPNDRIIITYSSVNSINATTPGSFAIGISGTFGDTGTATVNLVTNDQVSIDAEVAQSLTFTISDNTIGFGTLSPSASRYATGDIAGSGSETEAHNFIVGTNAANGYSVTATGTTLTSGANTITAIGAANTAPAIGTEQFGLRLTATGGTGTVAAPYAASGFAFDTAAFSDQVASATGASANTTFSARYLANITANTEAGSYSSVVTYIGTANY
jgi:hypothetical protein